MGGLDADALSWAALLAQCTDYARATASLGDDAEDVRWRDATASVVALHAVRFALSQLARVDEDERPLARDRAAVLIRTHVAALDRIWRGVPMPESLLQLQDDARTALDRAAYVGAVEVVWSGPGSFVVPHHLMDLVEAIARGEEPGIGTLLVMQPGTIVMEGEPVAWWVDRPWPDVGDAFDALDAEETDAPRQVYRVLDDAGRIERDLLSPIWCEPQAGMPLLVPLLAGGTPVGRFTMDPVDWESRQRAAIQGDADESPLPVESRSCGGDGLAGSTPETTATATATATPTGGDQGSSPEAGSAPSGVSAPGPASASASAPTPESTRTPMRSGGSDSVHASASASASASAFGLGPRPGSGSTPRPTTSPPHPVEATPAGRGAPSATGRDPS